MQDERGSLSGRLHVFIRVALGKEFFEQAPWPNLRYYRLASHIYNIFPIKSTKLGNSSISDKKLHENKFKQVNFWYKRVWKISKVFLQIWDSKNEFFEIRDFWNFLKIAFFF